MARNYFQIDSEAIRAEYAAMTAKQRRQESDRISDVIMSEDPAWLMQDDAHSEEMMIETRVRADIITEMIKEDQRLEAEAEAEFFAMLASPQFLMA